MKVPTLFRSARQRKAFALVEIVIALGIAAFAITAILGLLSVGILSSKDSTEDTVIANMAGTVLNDMRTRSFTDFVTVTPATGEIIVKPQQDVPDIFFDAGGRWFVKVSGTTSTPLTLSEALAQDPANPPIYQCKRTFRTLDSTKPDSGIISKPPTPIPYDQKLLQVTLTFSWPAIAAKPTKSNVVQATLVQY